MEYNTSGSNTVSKWTKLHYASLRMSLKLTDYNTLTLTANTSRDPRHSITTSATVEAQII